MDVTTITMEPEEAQEKLEAYRGALSKRHSAELDEEWRATERAYAELAKGTPLIEPLAAIAEAGWRPDGAPVLAIARADQRFVRWSVQSSARRWNNDTKQYFGLWAPMTWRFLAEKQRWDRQRSASLTFDVAVNSEPPNEPMRQVSTMAPLVPADVIPAKGCNLSRHFILWEVEKWEVVPPRDPILLRPIGGNLYAVVAQWDLTDLERAIIAGTRRRT